MKLLAYIAEGVLSIAAAAWILGAIQAGLFIQDRERVASEPNESSFEALSRAKKFVTVGSWNVAYIDEGSGHAIILLHGCPFQGYVYSRIIPILARHYRVIVPDLLGLGDTVVRLDDDYRLPNQVNMILRLMDQLGIQSALFVGHDHGAAIT